MDDEDGTEARVIRPSPALTITVWPGRLELPVLDGRPVGRRALQLIGALTSTPCATVEEAADAATGDPTDARGHELARELLARGGLVSVARDHDPDRPTAPARPAAGPTTDGRFRLLTPLSTRPTHAGFQLVGHDGDPLVDLTVEELRALPHWAGPDGIDPAVGSPDHDDRSDPANRRALIAQLVAAGLMVPAGTGGTPLPRLAPDDHAARVRRAFATAAAEADRRERRREAETGIGRTRVIPVSFTSGPPLALGLIVAHCLAHDGGRLTDHFEFRRDWEWDDDRLGPSTERPAVYLCSAYVWSHQQVLDVARAVKLRSPASLVVVGGPDAPKRAGDARAYLDAHPEVDVLARGEGEQTAVELLDALGRHPDGHFDLRGLASVPGLTVRLDDAVVRTPDRDRMADPGAVPSPFLTGLFDTYLDAPLDQVILETNRGCPYGCTFCDWGSATQSRIRQFPLDRVLREIDWAARAQATVVSFADANFGIFARDVDIAKHVTAVKAATSYPAGFGANFAKNTVKHLGPIITALVEGGIVNRGLLALQTMDEATLATIDRANIKVERYDAIATEMRAAGLPFAVELMMGLPGATVASFKDDLQQCIDREVEGTVNPTTVLVNSPMNAPEHRARHAIETAVPVGPGAHALIVATETFTRDEYRHMGALRRTFLLGENFGVTRHVGRLVRHTTGRREIDVLEQLHRDVVDDPEIGARHPFLRALFGQRSPALVIPVSGRHLVDDLLAYVAATYPELDATALATVGRVQHAVLPAFDRTYPQAVPLDHDYAAWFARVVAVKEQGHGADWPDRVPPLTAFGPGVLHVDDPHGGARRNLGCSVDHGPLLATWEHQSEVGRALYLAAPTPST